MTNKVKIAQEFMVKDIKKGKRDNISMSWDYDSDKDDIAQRFAVMLYTPEKGQHEHSHIAFTDDEIYKLGLWIDDYLRMKGKIS
jgi:hypothetical protein